MKKVKEVKANKKYIELPVTKVDQYLLVGVDKKKEFLVVDFSSKYFPLTITSKKILEVLETSKMMDKMDDVSILKNIEENLLVIKNYPIGKNYFMVIKKNQDMEIYEK